METPNGIKETQRWQIPYGDGGETTAIFDRSAAPLGDIVYIMAHGAGGNMEHKTMEAFAQRFAATGFDVVRFNFSYTHRGRRAPDRMPKLTACYQSVIEQVRSQLHPQVLLIGGQSMGGRAASMLAAEGCQCNGLILLAYPLHPAGKPEQLRDAHLPRIAAPVLCFNGTRDTLCRQDLMQPLVAGLSERFRMHWLEGADHGYKVLKASGRTQQQVFDEVAEVSCQWATQFYSVAQTPSRSRDVRQRPNNTTTEDPR